VASAATGQQLRATYRISTVLTALLDPLTNSRTRLIGSESDPDLEAKVLVELEGELNWRALTDVEQNSRIPRGLGVSLSKISSGQIWFMAELPCSLCRSAMIEA
jgi:hypothetical protein